MATATFLLVLAIEKDEDEDEEDLVASLLLCAFAFGLEPLLTPGLFQANRSTVSKRWLQ